jgi:replicative DNA helicase
MKIDIEDYVLNIISKQKDISNALRLRKEWFIKPNSKLLYEKIIEEQNTEISIIAKKHNIEEKYINFLNIDVYAPINKFEDYKIQLEIDYKKNVVKSEMNEFIKNDFDLEQASSKLIEISEFMKITIDTNNSIEEIIPEYKENLFNKKLEEPTLQTGYGVLDRNVVLFPQNTSIIGAGTGIGKSTLGINIFKNFILNGYNGVLYSLEMSKNEVLNKMVSSITGISNKKIYMNNYQLEENEKNAVEECLRRIGTSDCFIEDSFNMTIEDIKQDLRSKKLKSNIDFAFVDHIGLVGATEFKNDRRLSVSHMSREFKKISKELDIHIILIVQLNRDAETNNKPGLHHLSESHDLSRDASNIILIDRDREDIEYNMLDIYIEKCRQGRTGKFNLKINPNNSRIENNE